MSSGSALSLTVLGIFTVGAYYLGVPDSPDWLLTVGALLLVAGIVLAVRRGWQLRRRVRRRPCRRRRGDQDPS